MKLKPTPPAPPASGPTPCDSIDLSSDGLGSQPVNCLFFCLFTEALYVRNLMQAEGCIPAGVIVNIPDDPSSVSATRIIYGDDGRRVYLIQWTEMYQGAAIDFEENAGELLVQIKSYPKGFGDWKKNMTSADVERVGRQKDPSNPAPLPGVTYVSNGVAPAAEQTTGGNRAHHKRRMRRLRRAASPAAAPESA
jgi:hypothetical protein